MVILQILREKKSSLRWKLQYNCNYMKIVAPSDILTQLSLRKVNFFFNRTPFASNLYYFYMNTGTYKSNLEDKLGVLCYKGVISKVAQGMV